MAKTHTYQVTINGKVHTRTTERTYTHAIAVLLDIDRARERAHDWTDYEQKTAEENFQYYRDLADGSWWTRNGFKFGGLHDEDNKRNAQRVVDLGFDVYLASEKDDKVRRFEAELASGQYEWQVVAWAGSERLAQAQVKTRLGRKWSSAKAVIAIPAGADVTVQPDGTWSTVFTL